MYGGDFGRDLYAWIESADALDDISLRCDLDQSELDDAIVSYVEAGGLNVEEDKGSVEF
jgi:hypothetical protein